MKNILLYLSCFLITTNLFSQVRMDVWNKNPNTSRTVSMIGQTQLPKTFESRLPDGSTEIYDRWEVPTITIQTSSGKKYKHKPVAYKSRNGFSVLSYTDKGWEGFHQSKNGKFHSMSETKVSVDTVLKSQIENICSPPPLPNQTVPETMKTVAPPIGATLTNADYYNQSVVINKSCSNYVEVANDLHILLGNNISITQNWVTNLFLGVSTIYAREGINIFLTSMYIWETVDPYGYSTASSSTTTLYTFRDKIALNLPVNPNANFKHLLNAKYLGGIAFIGGDSDGYNPSNWGSNSYSRCAFSSMAGSLTTLPGPTANFTGTINNGSTGSGTVLTVTAISSGTIQIGMVLNAVPPNFQGIGTSIVSQTSGSTGGVGVYQVSTPKLRTSLPIIGIKYTPTNISNYYWALYVVSHEIGHNMGSVHTQNCRWRNDVGVSIGRLDSCYGGEINNNISCGTTVKDSKVPTIMSYCHLTGEPTTMFTRGFGKYPRFAMRSALYRSDIPFSNVSPPTVTTSSVTSITSTTASSGGNITNDGGGNLLSRGVCWAVSPTTPTISNSTTNDGVATGVYTSNLTGLAAGTTYNVRAYATNSAGTAYGSTVTFTTSAPSIPSLTTTAISAVGQTSATSGGTVTTDGGSSITSKGVVWSTSTAPTIALPTKTSNGTGSTAFTSSLSSLTLGTLYYVRAYATNSVGTGYGNEVTFTTSSAVIATLTTTSVTTFDNTTATMGGNITSSGGATVTARGVCYATTTNPDLTKTVVTIGSGTGTFSQSVTGLSQGVTYYVRAYATNLAGTSYGTQVTFKTLTTPTVTTTAATNIAATSVTSGGNVTSAGGGALTVTDRGVCYATTANPTILNSILSTGTGTGTFTSNITGLTQGVTYYIRAYATNTYGTSYGSQISFKTLTVPTVTTTAATSVTQTSASTGGNVTSAGGGTLTVTGRGVCYATTTTPTIANSVVASGTGTGSYITSLTGLTPGTVYYARAYATNSLGTGYGSQITITTPGVPVLTTTTITSISSSGAISGGTISSSVGSTVTAKGVCYATTQNPTIANSITSNGTGTSAFTSTITLLSPSTTYYVRAYATNTSGTGYGNELSFTTTSTGSPSVTTTAITSISQTTASSGGNVTSDGGLSVTARGVVWSTNISPTIALTTKTSNGTGTGVFTSSITGLSPSTTYYVRAYATNSNSTSYGTEQSFTTLSNNTIPVVTTTSITSITSTSASTGGDVTSAGGLTVTARGVCYATTQNPTTGNTVVTSGSGTGVFTSSLSGLTPSTTYYVRAYATNSLGTAYGTQRSFTTLTNNTTPVVTTTAVTSIAQTTASSGGNVTSDGGLTVTARGVCYATTQNPTIANSVVASGTGTGVFTSSITGLTASTTYYVRAYATNSVGTNYGSQVSFTTLATTTTPVVTTTAVTSITQTTASSGGNVTSDGGLTVSARGVCYATTQNPTISNSVVASGTGTGTFTSSITGLSPSTIYYVRAYATNSLGTAYGTQQSFTTLSNTTPLVTTSSITSITSNSATAGGDVTSAGGLTVTARGVCYATTQNPTIANSVVTSGTGTGVFTSSITGLTSSTTYYVRAYATNSLGTSYGTQQSFTTSTSVGLPVVTTTSASAITPTSAVSGGNVTSAGSNSVTSRGVCWSTSTSPTIANSKTTDGSGIGVFTSTLTSLTASTTYYVRSYATSTAGTAYGNQIQFTTTSAPSTSCQVTTFAASKTSGFWRFKWNINSNCTSYTVTLSRYNYTDPLITPPVGATPVATGNRLVNYVPTSTEIGQGFIDQQMSPQPASLGYWYTFEVKCNATTCSGSNTTKSGYFYTN